MNKDKFDAKAELAKLVEGQKHVTRIVVEIENGPVSHEEGALIVAAAEDAVQNNEMRDAVIRTILRTVKAIAAKYATGGIA